MFTMMIKSIPLTVLSPNACHPFTGDDGFMTNISTARSWRRFAAGIAVCALLITGCANGDQAETSGKQTPTQTVEPTPEPSDEPEVEEPEAPADAGDDEGEVVAPIEGTVERDEGDVTVTDVGVRIGVADAPFQLRIFADMRCPYCADLEQVMQPSAEEWGQGDEVSVEYVITTVLDDGSRTTFSARAANILAVVADQDPVSWDHAMAALYEMQPAKGEADPTDEDMLEALGEIGVNVDETFLEAVADLEFDSWNQEQTRWAGQDLGVPHVPYVFFNDSPMQDYNTFEQLIEMINDAIASN